MKRLLRCVFGLAALVLLAGCVVTAPIKVATTGAKTAAKTVKVGAKTTLKAGQAIVPDGDNDDKAD